MNKAEVLKTLSRELGITQTDTEELYDSFVTILTDHLSNNEGFTIPGFGSFSTKVRASYKSYNPHYKKMMLIPKKKVVNFNTSTRLKDIINSGAL